MSQFVLAVIPLFGQKRVGICATSQEADDATKTKRGMSFCAFIYLFFLQKDSARNQSEKRMETVVLCLSLFKENGSLVIKKRKLKQYFSF